MRIRRAPSAYCDRLNPIGNGAREQREIHRSTVECGYGASPTLPPIVPERPHRDRTTRAGLPTAFSRSSVDPTSRVVKATAEGIPSPHRHIHIIAQVRAASRSVPERPFSGIEAVSLINECRHVLLFPGLLPECCLPAIRVARPLVNRQHTGKVSQIRTLASTCSGTKSKTWPSSGLTTKRDPNCSPGWQGSERPAS